MDDSFTTKDRDNENSASQFLQNEVISFREHVTQALNQYNADSAKSGGGLTHVGKAVANEENQPDIIASSILPYRCGVTLLPEFDLGLGLTKTGKAVCESQSQLPQTSKEDLPFEQLSKRIASKSDEQLLKESLAAGDFDRILKSIKEKLSSKTHSGIDSIADTIMKAQEKSAEKFVEKPLTAEDKKNLDKEAADIVKLIQKDESFSAIPVKRARVQAAFDKATADGEAHLTYLVEKVNEQLSKNPGNKMELKAAFSTVTAWYSKDAGNLSIMYGAFPVKEPRSEVKLINKDTGELEDRLNCTIRTKGPEYLRSTKPEQTPSSQPDSPNQPDAENADIHVPKIPKQ
jgi:hypothetical protein